MNVQAPVRDDALAGTSGQPQLVQPAISVVDLLQIVKMRLRIFLASAGALFFLIMFVTVVMPPLFKGSSFVMLDARQTNTVNVPQVLGDLSTDQASVLNQVEILQSRELATRVVERLHLDQDPEFIYGDFQDQVARVIGWFNPARYFRPQVADYLNADEKKELALEQVLDQFEHRLDISQVELSTAIEIDFQSNDPAKAARIANAIADAYVEDQLNAKLEATQQATRWISGRLGKLSLDAKRAQAALENYKAANHLTETTAASGSGTISVLDQQIAAASTQLMQAQMDRAQAEATSARVRSLVGSGHAADVSQVVNSPLISQLRQQETQLVQQQAQLASRYGPEHPKMLDLQAEKRDLELKINEEIQHVVGTASNDVAVAGAREGALQAQLKQLEAQSNVQGTARIRENELLATAQSASALYEAFVARVKQTEAEETLQIPDARIISRASIPTRASFPPLLIIFAASIPLSLLFGFMVTFILERLDHGFRTVSRVEEKLGLPVLATLPDLSEPSSLPKFGKKDPNTKPKNAADQVIDKPLSSYTEAVRGLHMGLSLSNVDRSPKVILVTSAVPGEGKTTTALSLARHLTQTGQRVILVDGDLRRPNILASSGIKSPGYDVIDVLQGSCTLDQAIVPDTKSTLSLLPAVKHVKNAPDLLESQAMRKMVAHLSSVYDMVIIDSAPILPVNDTKILVRLADSVLFVVRWEQTPRDAAFDAVKSLREIHAPLAGVVLSRADSQRFHYYSFGYGGYYYSYSKYYESA